MRNGWNQKDLARNLHVSQATTTKIIRYRINELTINQLFIYLEQLHPGFEILISI